MYKPQLPTTILELTWLLIAADTYDCPAIMKEIQTELDKLLQDEFELARGGQKAEGAKQNQQVDQEPAAAAAAAAPNEQQGAHQQLQQLLEQLALRQQQQQEEVQEVQELGLLPDQQGHLTWDVVQEVYQVSLRYPQYMQKQKGLLWPLWEACTDWVGASNTPQQWSCHSRPFLVQLKVFVEYLHTS